MRAKLTPRPSWRWPASAAAVAAFAAAIALSVTVPAAATTAPSPPPVAAGPSHPAFRHPRTAHCRITSTGKITGCHARLPVSRLPRGAADKSTVSQAVTAPATMVDTRTWTTGGGNTFPGADVPFGQVQWSPDTMPDNNAGGGYSYGDSQLWGYSLTHVSGPGCGAAGDVPILPMTGALPSGTPSQYTTSFTNTAEVAQAGYYSAESNLPDTITSDFAATKHSAMGQFTFPATTQADFLVKLAASQNGDAATSAKIVGDDEIQGSVTSGDFCGESDNDGQSQLYTVYFDLVFSQPFTASQIVTEPGQSDPDSVFLTFDTTSNPVINAKVGISYVSAANAQLNWQQDNPGWGFASVRKAGQQAWNKLLGRIQVSGGSYAQTQEFYSLLYKDFLQPNVTSDVNGQYLGADSQVHTLASGQADQYGIFSGWDIYHSLSQLQAMLDPVAASDMAQSLLNYYAQNGLLQQWGYLNLDNYVMVGDPSDAIIADDYAFGATGFDQKQALTDMVKQATTVNDVRPGEALEQKYGYLPEDGTYGCCNPHGFVSSLLEYDTEDFALSQYAAAQGDSSDAAMLAQRANNWVNVFDSGNDLLTPRYENGAFESGITDTSTAPYVEGDAYEYLWDVPNDYAGLFSLLGGNAKVAPELAQYLSEPNGFGQYAQLTNEFGFGEQNAPDYAGDPAGTQQAVNNIRNGMYLPGPSGLDNNDDLGANSSAFVWDMLGMYPQNPGSGDLVLSSPGFPHVTITLPGGKTVTSTAPGASPTKFYVKSLKINGTADSKLYVPFATLAKGATLKWGMSATATSWGSAPADAPPSYGPVFAASATASPATVTLAPGASGTARVTVTSSSGAALTAQWTASAATGVTVSPSSGSVSVPAGGSGTITLGVTAGQADGDYPVTLTLTSSAGSILPVQLDVIVDRPGDLSPFYNVTGISDDSDGVAANYDGDGYSYSEQALTAAGAAPGATITSGGLTYTWPAAAAGQPDAVVAGGQTIPVAVPAGAATIGFLGSATNGGTTGGSGTVTVNYTDGTSSTATLGLSDWTLDANSVSPSYGNTTVIATPYRNEPGGSQAVNTYVFAATIGIDSAKTVASVTLPPTSTNGSLGIFAISGG